MKCINCRAEMELIEEWIEPYPYPSEWLWGCPHCHAKCNYNEAYGYDWEGIDE